MKNRKIIVVAFLVMAMLVVGVGYAAINGSLIVGGTAKYLGYASSSEIRDSVQFDAVTSESGCSVELTSTSAGSSVMDKAVMTVEFHDFDSANNDNEFTTSATLTIGYATEVGLDTSGYPSITLDALENNSKSIATITGSPAGTFEVDVQWEDGTTTEKTMEPNSTLDIVVTVKYTEPGDEYTGDIATLEDLVNIAIALPFAS